MQPSMLGGQAKEPGSVAMPVMQRPILPSRVKEMSVPVSRFTIRAVFALVSRALTFSATTAQAGKSASIAPCISMCGYTSGIVTIRQPAARAFLTALVCDMDFVVTRKAAVAFSIAAPTISGTGAPCRSVGSITIILVQAPSIRQARAIWLPTSNDS